MHLWTLALLFAAAACTLVSDADVSDKFGGEDTSSDSVTGPEPDTAGDADTDADTDTDTDTETDTDSEPDTGTALPDIEGRTYDLDLAGANVTWSAPNAGPFLVDYLETTHILLMAEEAGTFLDTVAALGWTDGDDGTLSQYPCAASIDFEARDFSESPAFTVGPKDAALISAGYTIPVNDLTYAGTFAADGSEVLDAQITGMIDTRPLTESIGMDACSLLASLGDTCESCPDGEPACVFMSVSAESAPEEPGLAIDPDLDPTSNAYCD